MRKKNLKKGASLLLRAPIKTGSKQGLKVPYGGGLTTHTSPASCVKGGNILSKALTRASVGWVLSLIRD